MTSFIPIEHVKFNKKLTNIEQQHDSVTLTFADGEIEVASILAGADGIQSTVRNHVLGQEYSSEVPPVYADAYCYRSVIPMTEAEEILGDLTDVAKFYFGHGKSAVTYRISEGKVSRTGIPRTLLISSRNSISSCVLLIRTIGRTVML